MCGSLLGYLPMLKHYCNALRSDQLFFGKKSESDTAKEAFLFVQYHSVPATWLFPLI